MLASFQAHDRCVVLFVVGLCATILAPGQVIAQASDPEQESEQEEQAEQVLTVGETVEVLGIRAGADLPVTTTELSRVELDQISYGQDVPQLLQYTPSMNWYSDSGTGSNYSYFSLRGITQTRINMTYDGAPLNDPAEHALYFNNFHDFVNEVDSVQIQRGVGTSTVGSPAFGGSVNFASRPPAPRAGLDGRIQFGSFDTTRASLGAHTGTFGDGF